MSHWRYLNYVVRHKWFVLVAGLRTGAPIWRLLVHDWSKFTLSEWLPYSRYFYGNLPSWDEAKIQCPGYPYRLTKEGVRESFDRAWLRHQHRNAHHWQHWILREDSGATKILDMPEHFAREMVADWMGAGRAITGKWEAAEWYSKNAAKIQLTPHTETVVRRLLREGRLT